jgi:hypothetical protein
MIELCISQNNNSQSEAPFFSFFLGSYKKKYYLCRDFSY